MVWGGMGLQGGGAGALGMDPPPVEGISTGRENPSGWRNLWVCVCDPPQLIRLHRRHCGGGVCI